MQLRPYHRSKRILDELTTENGRLVVKGATIQVRFPADVTAEYKFERAVYDLLIIGMNGLQYRVAEGEIEFRPGVTR